METKLDRTVYGVALLLGVLPLWVTRHLPLVDLPQHLHLISVLHRLEDPTTLYPGLFEARGQLTPYLGYYYAVSVLSWLLPLEIANKVFLSAYVVGMPLGMAFLLRSLRRPIWPSLLALPFAYGDSLAWGFINYCSALPLAFVACGLFVRAIADPEDRPDRRRGWGLALAGCLTAVLLSHVQAFLFLGVALPVLLAMTRAGAEGGRSGVAGWVHGRRYALLGVVPSVVLFLAWVGLRLGQPSNVEYGAPWRAWGPVLSPQNLAFKSFRQNLDELPRVLANMLRDGSDRYTLYAAIAVAATGWLVAAARGSSQREGLAERWRLLVLGLVALALYFTLPFDIRGYMYYLNTRFAHLAAPLLLAAVPVLPRQFLRPFLLAAAAVAVVLCVPLSRGFAAFGAEAAALDELVGATAPRPMVMGLIFDPFSRVVSHPVYLHGSTVIARERGGAANFSFALTPHSPLKYRGEPPPTFPSEWRPDQFRYAELGQAYDHFLVRGRHPAQVFGPLLQSELAVAGHAGSFWLVRRR